MDATIGHPESKNYACYFDLPIHVTVERSVLGGTTASNIGDVPVDVITPIPHPMFDYPAFPPTLPGVQMNPAVITEFTQPYRWAMTFSTATEHGDPEPDDGRTNLLRIALILHDSDEIGLDDDWFPERSRIDRVGLHVTVHVAAWFEIARTWLEVLSGQDLDYARPHYDTYYPGEGLHRWSEGAWLSKELPEVGLPWVRPVTPKMWDYAFTQAAVEYPPPLEHVLAHRARASLRRGDLRQAALDIGTGAEMVINKLYDTTKPPKGNKHLDQRQRHFGSLREDLHDWGVGLVVDDYDLDILVDIRNGAAHEGETPTESDARSAHRTMTELIAAYGTPRPSGL